MPEWWQTWHKSQKQRQKCHNRGEHVGWETYNRWLPGGEIKQQKELQGTVLTELDTLQWGMDVYKPIARLSLQFCLNEVPFYLVFLSLLGSVISWHAYARIYLHASPFANWLYRVPTLALGRGSFWGLPGWALWEFESSSLGVVQERLIL